MAIPWIEAPKPRHAAPRAAWMLRATTYKPVQRRPTAKLRQRPACEVTRGPRQSPAKRVCRGEGRRRERRAVFAALTQTAETEHSELRLTRRRIMFRPSPPVCKKSVFSFGKAGRRCLWQKKAARFCRSRAIGGPRRISPAREWQMRQGGVQGPFLFLASAEKEMVFVCAGHGFRAGNNQTVRCRP